MDNDNNDNNDNTHSPLDSFVIKTANNQEPEFIITDDGITHVEALHILSMPYFDDKNVQWRTTDGRIGYDNSSRRYKENITTLEDDFTKILKATPVKYTRPTRPNRWELGYIAEDMDELGLQTLITYDDDGIPDNFNYEKMILYVVEVLKLHESSKHQQAQAITQLTRENAALKVSLQQQTSVLGDVLHEVAAIKAELQTVLEAAVRPNDHIPSLQTTALTSP